jgi:hypothetical protein
VGHGDEPPVWRGITHLVEHLALYRLGLVDHPHNGETEARLTSFYAVGTVEEVVSYLNGVARNLVDLPFERLAQEKDILRQEGSLGRRSFQGLMASTYYGYQGDGLADLAPLGLPGLTPEDLKTWTSRFFTRDNAIVWFDTQEPPPGLDLPLPAGTRRPVPTVSPIPTNFPAEADGPPEMIGLLAQARRSAAKTVYQQLLRRALFKALRHEAATSYHVSVEAVISDHLAVVADIPSGRADLALGILVDTLAALRWGRLDQEQIEAVVAESQAMLSDPYFEAGCLPLLADNYLTNEPLYTAQDLVRDLRAVTPDSVRAVAEEVAASALLVKPDGVSGEWAGFKPLSPFSGPVVDGKRYPYRGNTDYALILGTEGISLVEPDGPQTYYYRDCIALGAYPDGARLLVLRQGGTVSIEPSFWGFDKATIHQIDSSVDEGIIIQMPPRSPDEIPPSVIAQDAVSPGANVKSGSSPAGLSGPGLIAAPPWQTPPTGPPQSPYPPGPMPAGPTGYPPAPSPVGPPQSPYPAGPTPGGYPPAPPPTTPPQSPYPPGPIPAGPTGYPPAPLILSPGVRRPSKGKRVAAVIGLVACLTLAAACIMIEVFTIQQAVGPPSDPDAWTAAAIFALPTIGLLVAIWAIARYLIRR